MGENAPAPQGLLAAAVRAPSRASPSAALAVTLGRTTSTDRPTGRRRRSGLGCGRRRSGEHDGRKRSGCRPRPPLSMHHAYPGAPSLFAEEPNSFKFFGSWGLNHLGVHGVLTIEEVASDNSKRLGTSSVYAKLLVSRLDQSRAEALFPATRRPRRS